VLQLQAMCTALPPPPHGVARCHLPAAATVLACAIECEGLSAGHRPVGPVCGFDLSAFNDLRASSHYETVAGPPRDARH
jgi:hypothetical protein